MFPLVGNNPVDPGIINVLKQFFPDPGTIRNAALFQPEQLKQRTKTTVTARRVGQTDERPVKDYGKSRMCEPDCGI